MEIKDIARITGGQLLGNAGGAVRYLAADSRSLPHSGGVMFLAIRGDRHNGNDYLSEVYKSGIRLFLVDERPDIHEYPDATFCLVDNTLDALHRLAASVRKRFAGKVIGITGSNGKTIVKEWLSQVLQEKRTVVRSPRSYNSQLGVPLSLWLLKDPFDFAIIEAGISRPGEMEKLEKIICPEIGILTNIGPAHGENFISDTQKLEEKIRLFAGCEKIIYCADGKVDGQPVGSWIGKLKGTAVCWSLGNEADYSFMLHANAEARSWLHLERRGHGPSDFELPFPDHASVENICHVIVCLLELGFEPEEITYPLTALEPVEMRLQILKGVHGSTLVNDAYNSDPSGLEMALNVLLQQKNNREYAVILSDMVQSGIESASLYGQVADMLQYKNIGRFFGIGESLTAHRNLFPEQSRFFSSTAEFLEEFNPGDVSGCAVLIKGARKFQFEKITRELQLQAHKTVLEINVNALVHNLNYYHSLIGPGVKIMVMVKALSYGSGSHEIAGILQHEKVDYLAVAFPDEGFRLRKSRIQLPIMVMNADMHDYHSLIEYNLEPEIYSLEGLKRFTEACRYSGRTGYPVHIKLDTGMHRLGINPEEMEELSALLAGREIRVASIFTHLAASEEPGMDDFTRYQVNLFRSLSDSLVQQAAYPVMRHVLNSAGVERFPEYQFDMVRIGIGLYGHGIGSALEPVSTFRTVISQVRDLEKGETVGYSRQGLLTRNSRIATIPVGYADGIDRRLGNGKFFFAVKGQQVPTVGNICMDMTMIDITGIDATVGDQVELFGKECPVSHMAEVLDTIEYEILTSIPERVKRIYIRE